MKAKGIQNAAALLGGFDGWRQAGLPIERETIISSSSSESQSSELPRIPATLPQSRLETELDTLKL